MKYTFEEYSVTSYYTVQDQDGNEYTLTSMYDTNIGHEEIEITSNEVDLDQATIDAITEQYNNI